MSKTINFASLEAVKWTKIPSAVVVCGDGDWYREWRRGWIGFEERIQRPGFIYWAKVASNESLGRVWFAATDFHAAGVTVIFSSSA
jgi:hypothetical protein